MKSININILVVLIVMIFCGSCSKKEETATPKSTTNPTTEPIKISFSKIFYSSCPVDFVAYISYNNSNNYLVSVGTTSIGGCSSGINLNLSTEVVYRFSLGQTSVSAEVYNGNVTFHDNNGVISMVVQNIYNPNGYSLALMNNCGSGVIDIVIQ